MKEKILVIEDSLEVAANIADILRLDNFNVYVANNGMEGVKLALLHKPDLILCDIMMPELDGYGVFHVLSKHSSTSHTPFIFLSSKSEKSDIRKGMGLGADDYIVKPFEGSDLLDTVEIRLKRNRQLRTAFENEPQDLDDFFNKTKEISGFESFSGKRTIKKFEKKDFIYSDGQPSGALFYLMDGQVKTCKINNEGKEFIISVYSGGQYFGYVALLKNIPYNENAVALTDVTLEIIQKEDFHLLINTNRVVANQFMKILSNNVLEAENRLIELAYHSVRQRVASAILWLYEKEAAQNKKERIINMLRRDIAGIVGTALETLNRTISDFREEGLIDIFQGKVHIQDIKGLEKISR